MLHAGNRVGAPTSKTNFILFFQVDYVSSSHPFVAVHFILECGAKLEAEAITISTAARCPFLRPEYFEVSCRDGHFHFHKTSISKMTGELSNNYCYHKNDFYRHLHSSSSLITSVSSVHKICTFLSSLFHKFCAATSLSDYDPYLLAATSLYLAGKVFT